ncbi:MAG: hypothetical protein WCI97_08795 [Bacteroidota bacterium]
MAEKKEVVLEILIDASNSAKTVGELKKSIKDLQSAALTAGEQGNKSLADQYINAAGEAKDKINDLNQAIKNAGSDTRKLDGLVQIGSGIASGFAAAQGAAALFGGANKDLEKALLKVQAASALAAGAQQIANLVQKESAASMLVLSTATVAYTTVVGGATGAMKIFRLALAATGIGAIAILVYELYENFDKVKKVLANVIPESVQKAFTFLKDSIGSIYDKVKDFIGLGPQVQGTGNLFKGVFDNFKKVSDDGKKAVAEFNEKAKEQQEYLKKLSESGSPGSIGYYNFLLGESTDRLNKLVPGSAAYNAELKNNIKLQKDLAATQQAAKSPEELQKAAADAAKKAEELKIKQAADFAALSEKEYADSIKSTSEYYDHLIAVAKLNNEDTIALENKKAEELIGIGDEYKQKTLAQQDALLLAKKKQKEDAIKKEVDDAVKLAQENLAGGVGGSELGNQIALENALYEQAKVANTNLEELEKTHLAKIAALKKASAVKDVQAGLKMAQDSLSAIQNLSDVVYSSKLANVKKGSKEEEAILRKQFETNKKMQIASAIINGALAVTNIIATVPKADFGVSTAIMLVAAASATAASIAKIASTKFDSTGGSSSSSSFGGSGAPTTESTPINPNNQPTTNLNGQGSGNNNNGQQVLVVETYKQVSNRVNVIESRAQFR